MYRETAQSERLYRKLSGRYDRFFERAILAEPRLTEIARELTAGKRVLDLACGNGRWIERLEPAAYVGLDLSAAMLGQARRRFADSNFVRGDMSALPFAEGSFDTVISMFGAMGHLPPDGQRAMVADIHRVLVSGGALLLTNGNTWSPFNFPSTIVGNRVRLEGVYVKVHSSNPRRMAGLLDGFRGVTVQSYDYSYIPILPLKFAACLAGRDWRPIYEGLMSTFENCRYIPTLRWFGKQLVAVCRKA